MDLWIRSQDKKRLTKVEDLYLVHDDKQFCDYLGNNMVGYLAKYTKQGRALEVLDEIQGKISKNECLKNMMPKVTDIRGHEEQFGQLFKDMIYEMPEE